MIDKMKSADWIVSEAGLQDLMSAGISIGWLKAWVLSAGATASHVHLLDSNSWQDSTADWQLFFASADELEKSASRLDDFKPFETRVLKLENPVRDANVYVQGNRKKLFLSIGDIAYQRQTWLSFLNNARPLKPLYVCADLAMPIALESGLSAGLLKPACYLNGAGLLLEEQVIASLKQHKLLVRTVESCTGGAIAARLCRVPGASAVLDRAWVTYSNAAKEQEVAVNKTLIDRCGAVSQEVVVAMAEGGADAGHVCVAVSGIAGPGGGTAEKPVGTVWIAVALEGHATQSQCFNFSAARHDIQHQSVVAALCLLLKTVENN